MVMRDLNMFKKSLVIAKKNKIEGIESYIYCYNEDYKTLVLPILLLN